MTAANLAEVHKFFAQKVDPNSPDYSLAKFRSEWSHLTVEDKAQIRDGIGDGTLTY